MPAAIEEVRNHVEKNIGPVATVFHEIVSDDLHIDLHHVKSTFFRRYEVVVTSGMSEKPMNVPPDAANLAYAELVAVLPKDWPLSRPAFEDERNYWPLRLLKDLARYAHHANTWLGFGHTLANAESEEALKPYRLDAGRVGDRIDPKRRSVV